MNKKKKKPIPEETKNKITLMEKKSKAQLIKIIY